MPQGVPGGPGRFAGRWLVAAALGAVLLLTPLLLWADPLDGYDPRVEGVVGLYARAATLAAPFERRQLFLDDFGYSAKSRTEADLRRGLMRPHNTHVVPLFRVWTFLWLRAAGGMARAPVFLAFASYLTYAAAVALVGHVAAWETGRAESGLAAMGAFGTSALLAQSASWYSASQAVGAAAVALLVLAALQRWRAVGGAWWLLAAFLAAVAAPLVWTVGYVAGPAGFAYLWADGRGRARRAALVPIAASALTALACFTLAGTEITSARHFQERPFREAIDPWQGAICTAQGLVEFLALGNLGLRAETTLGQALVLGGALMAAWSWSRGWGWRPRPLEAAGATLAVCGFLLPYTARGYMTFANLRALSWYQATPQVGAVLFAVGWLQGPAAGPTPRSLAVPTWRGLFAVVGLVPLLFLLQLPPVRVSLERSAPALTKSEQGRFALPGLRRVRARVLEAEEAAWQRRFLARVDRAQALAAREGLGRAELRRALGRVFGPGMPEVDAEVDAYSLMDLPESGAGAGSSATTFRLRAALAAEPRPRPGWLRPGDRWPPGPGP